ncbi:MlaC/ttg2D family ABC transporter substrate-binding protein [Kiritimatiella glycovorans]|uniref:Putative phospholipid-binding protein MlaC n=1 Tax=Kiritimatiella glycovorans TaxID=1307763 RepID=A0A0G3EDH5_9BACT|nr:ABC transporter substrate-binding protein [Kiritimatiella glycovorans]AKJ63437.1 putative phospholipid-binding protein MlaC precursor [Kiritimatiella glycovorans]
MTARRLLRTLIVPALLAAPTAAPAGEALDELRGATDEVLRILRNEELGEEDREEKIRSIALKEFDWRVMTRSAAGRHWRTLNDAQRDRLVPLFRDLITRTYLEKLEHYSGEEIEFTGDSVQEKYGTVNARVLRTDGKEISLVWRVIRHDAGWKVYDVVADGVSIVRNYRDQINEILTSGSFEELVSKLEQKKQQEQKKGKES